MFYRTCSFLGSLGTLPGCFILFSALRSIYPTSLYLDFPVSYLLIPRDLILFSVIKVLIPSCLEVSRFWLPEKLYFTAYYYSMI